MVQISDRHFILSEDRLKARGAYNEGDSKPLSQQRKQMSLIDLCNLGEERAPERRLSKEQFDSLSKQVLVSDSSFLTSDSNRRIDPLTEFPLEPTFLATKQGNSIFSNPLAVSVRL